MREISHPYIAHIFGKPAHAHGVRPHVHSKQPHAWEATISMESDQCLESDPLRIQMPAPTDLVYG